MKKNNKFLKKNLIIFLFIGIIILSHIKVYGEDIAPDNNSTTTGINERVASDNIINDSSMTAGTSENNNNNNNSSTEEINPYDNNLSNNLSIGIDSIINNISTETNENNLSMNASSGAGLLENISSNKSSEEISNTMSDNNLSDSSESSQPNKTNSPTSGTTSSDNQAISSGSGENLNNNNNREISNNTLNNTDNSSYDYVPADNKNLSDYLKNNSNLSNKQIEELLNYDSMPDGENDTLSNNCYNHLNNRITYNISEFICPNIDLYEIKKSNNEIDLYLNSSDDVDHPIIVTYQLENNISISNIDGLRLFSIDENRSVDIEIKSDNGYIYAISWTIPPLSDWSYTLTLYPGFNSKGNDINLSILSPSGTSILNNPVNFAFKTEYSYIDRLICSFNLDDFILDNLTNANFSINIMNNLTNGIHQWKYSCKDPSSDAINKSLNGTIMINETFIFNTSNDVYLNNERIYVKLTSANAIPLLEMYSPNGNKVSLGSFNPPYPKDYIIESSLINIPGTYILNMSTNYFSNSYSIYKNISIAGLDLGFDKINTTVNEDVNFRINITSPGTKIINYTIDFGDGNLTFRTSNENNINVLISHRYSQANDYIIRLKASISDREFNMTKNGIKVISGTDTQAPYIYLIGPADNSVINTKNLLFSYVSEDNIKITNCTFELYNNTGGWGVKDYSRIDYNLYNNQSINISLTDFINGNYYWDVECYDNSSNKRLSEIRDFTITLSNSTTNTNTVSINTNTVSNSYAEKNRVDALISSLDSFLEKEKDMTLDEKEVMDDLDLSSDLGYYQKRLVQIDQGLGTEMKFIAESQKDAKKKELLDELSDLEKKVPKSLSVTNSQEFIKNSLGTDIGKILEEYYSLKQDKSNINNIKKISEALLKIQKDMDIQTKVRNVELDYTDNIKKFTLVTKKISLMNSTSDRIIEYVPKEISSPDKIVFLTNAENDNKSSAFEIMISDLKDNKLSYTIEGYKDPKDIEKTESLLYKEMNIENIDITGYSIFTEYKLSSWFYICLIISFVFIFLYLTTWITQKLRVNSWKKEEDVIRIFDLIKESKKSIKKENLETAKEKYNKIKEIYPLIPQACKKHVFKDVKNIQVYIDKKDIYALMKEYKLSKKEKREEDAKRIYECVKSNYKRLPKKYQKEIYKKMFKD